jgi:hypothetical protein
MTDDPRGKLGERLTGPFLVILATLAWFLVASWIPSLWEAATAPRGWQPQPYGPQTIALLVLIPVVGVVLGGFYAFVCVLADGLRPLFVRARTSLDPSSVRRGIAQDPAPAQMASPAPGRSDAGSVTGCRACASSLDAAYTRSDRQSGSRAAARPPASPVVPRVTKHVMLG